MTDTANPKDAIAGAKLPLEIVPTPAIAYIALGLYEGYCKYGRFNWRGTEVKASVYVGAALRHLGKYFNGEDSDPASRIPHLANALASISIVVDALASGTLIDDRAPAIQIGAFLAELEGLMPHVRELFADKAPKHWTIADDTVGRRGSTQPLIPAEIAALAPGLAKGRRRQ